MDKTYHEDPKQLHVNAEPGRNYFIPFGEGECPFWQRENQGVFSFLMENGNFDIMKAFRIWRRAF